MITKQREGNLMTQMIEVAPQTAHVFKVWTQLDPATELTVPRLRHWMDLSAAPTAESLEEGGRCGVLRRSLSLFPSCLFLCFVATVSGSAPAPLPP